MPESDYGQNVNKVPKEVRHANLERVSEGSYKSVCPVCKKGTLLVRRNSRTFKLEAHDNCVRCGQRFVYIDIGQMQEADTAS